MPIDVSPETLEAVVLEGSRRQPVVVDFWAPWCAPCRQISPLLEELERDSGGRFVLAKLDVERHPDAGRAFGITGIPALRAFRDGGIVAELQGLAPKPRLVEWLRGFVPGEESEALEAARRAEADGDDAKAEGSYRSALELKPGLGEALVGLAALLERTGRLEEAGALVEGLDGATAARIRLERQATEGPSLEAARRAAKADGVEALYQLGLAEAAAANHRAALEALLEVVRRDRSFGEDAGRKAMLEVFQLLGEGSDLVDAFRRQLAAVLF